MHLHKQDVGPADPDGVLWAVPCGFRILSKPLSTEQFDAAYSDHVHELLETSSPCDLTPYLHEQHDDDPHLKFTIAPWAELAALPRLRLAVVF